jgi:hypothetical protein
MRTDRQTDRHDEANSYLSQFCERVQWPKRPGSSTRTPHTPNRIAMDNSFMMSQDRSVSQFRYFRAITQEESGHILTADWTPQVGRKTLLIVRDVTGVISLSYPRLPFPQRDKSLKYFHCKYRGCMLRTDWAPNRDGLNDSNSSSRVQLYPYKLQNYSRTRL